MKWILKARFKSTQLFTARVLLGILVMVISGHHAGFAQTTQYFPQLADGGGYITTIYFAGLGKANSTVTVDFFGQNGTGLLLQTNLGTASTFTFTLAAAGEVSLRTGGASASINVGWARVTSEIPIGATEVFSLYSGSTLISQAGVLPADPTGAATLVVSIDGKGQDTGIAIANAGLSATPLTFTLYDRAGAVAATSTTTLSPRNQMAKFVDQFQGFERIPIPFEGTLSVSGLSLFSLVGLLLNGDKLSTLSTFPGRIPPPISNTVSVAGISYLYLAGMPAGTTIDQNTAPLNSPIEAGLTLVPGRELQFSPSGTINEPSSFSHSSGIVGPDGFSTILDLLSCSAGSNGIGGVRAWLDGLVGVFVGPTQPAPPAPQTLDFSGGVAQLTRLQPALKQPFYIGSGVTSNQSKRFVIPEGATRLFVAPLDCNRSVSSKTGSFSVTVQYVP